MSGFGQAAEQVADLTGPPSSATHEAELVQLTPAELEAHYAQPRMSGRISIDDLRSRLALCEGAEDVADRAIVEQLRDFERTAPADCRIVTVREDLWERLVVECNRITGWPNTGGAA